MGRFQENPDGTGKSPQIAHVRPHHRAIARAYILGAKRPTELSEMFALSVGQISRILGSPLFQAETRRLEEEAEIVAFDMAKDLQLMGELALQNLDSDLHIEPSSLEHRKHRAKVSTDVLGMLGLRPSGSTVNVTKVLNVQNNHYEKTVEELEEKEVRDEIMEMFRNPDGGYE